MQQPQDNREWFKALTTEDLSEIFQDVSFKTTPMHHQFVSLAWGMQRDRVVYWFDIGTGKTLSALYTCQLWGDTRILAVCPNSVVIPVWMSEVAKHTNWTVVPLLGTLAEREEALRERANVYIINYEGLQWLFGRKVPVTPNEEDPRIKFVPDREQMQRYRFDCVIFDEGHYLKNGKAVRTKIAHWMAQLARHSIVLTGTPLSKNEMDLWGEYWVLDGGSTLGSNYWAFLHTYFLKVNKFKWVPRKGTKERILERIAPVTLRYERSECLDLPEATYTIRHVDPSREQLDLATKILEGDRVDLPVGYLDTSTLVNRAGKLAQVTGGFVIGTEGPQRLDTNPKGEELANLLQELFGKVLVFHQYEEEGRIIQDICKKLGLKFGVLRGEVSRAIRDKSIAKFRDEEDVRVLIAHPRCGGEGLDLTVATTAIFYSNDYSGATTRPQAEGRILRTGQTKPCLFVDLLVKGSIDERIHRAMREKRDLAQSVLDWIRGRVRPVKGTLHPEVD